MSAIATLTSLGTSALKGQLSKGLRTKIDSIIAKINEAIGRFNAGTLDTLVVGAWTGYYNNGHSWMVIDGTNPPMFSKIWMQDQTSGNFYEVYVDSGVIAAPVDKGAP